MAPIPLPDYNSFSRELFLIVYVRAAKVLIVLLTVYHFVSLSGVTLNSVTSEIHDFDEERQSFMV